MADLLEKYKVARENTLKAHKKFEELNNLTFEAKMYALRCEKLEKEAFDLLMKQSIS